MKKLFSKCLLVLILILVPALSMAQNVVPVAPIATPEVTMPPIAINYTLLWNAETRKISKAPSVDITLISAFDKVLLGNFQIAFPAKDQTSNTFVGGPAIGVDFFKLISKQTAIQIEKNFKLRTSLGVLFDVFHLDGMDMSEWKKVTNIGFSLGFAF
jgi:hypothetical protein